MKGFEGPVRANADDYDGIVELAEICFPRDKKLGGMVPRWGHCFRKKLIENSILIKDRGRIVAHVGCIDQTVMSGPSEVKVSGVSSVCTSPSHRGRGLMSALLLRAIGFMEECGYAASDLGGNRLRYSRFGWENAGRGWRFVLSRRSVKAHPAPEGFRVEEFQGTEEEVKATLALHEQGRAGVIRDAELQRILLTRLGKRVLIARSGGELDSYIVIEPEPDSDPRNPHVSEVAGSRGGVHSLVLHLLDQGAGSVLVPSPWDHHLNPRLRELSSGWAGGGTRMYRIVDLRRLFSSFSEELGRRYDEAGFEGERSVSLGLDNEESVAISISAPGVSFGGDPGPEARIRLERREMVRFLLGPAAREVGSRLPRGARFLQALLPLDLYLWPNETV